MPILVHLADEREAATIKENGIKIGKYQKGIFCMPVLQNFYVTHQWLREMKRCGAKTFVGIYFRLDSKMKVYAGKYNEEHKEMQLGETIKEIMSIEDPLGYELIITRKIKAKEIHKISSLPQNLGWRYFPSSHLKKPWCACPVCIPRGSIKGKKLRRKIEPPSKKLGYPEIILKLRTEDDEDEICNLLYALKETVRRTNPTDLVFLFDKNSNSINRLIALTLASYRHKKTRAILVGLLESNDDETREYATDSLLNLYGQEIKKLLIEKNDIVIKKAIDEWKDEKS